MPAMKQGAKSVTATAPSVGQLNANAVATTHRPSAIRGLRVGPSNINITGSATYICTSMGRDHRGPNTGSLPVRLVVRARLDRMSVQLEATGGLNGAGGM